ncbi:organic anion transporter 3-like [Symsagittifera roscoffensis]|uniref:organic anion transporter 3-like n=1 Tax=Symsagittifera roscoffensis TaxID=84072 RepID=UPI00307C118D
MNTGDFESNLDAAGNFGKAQWIIILLNFYITSYVGWQAYIPVFATREVDFYCADNSNSSEISQIDIDSNLSTKRYLETSKNNGSDFDQTCVDHCSKYVYKSKPNSIVSDFDLACGSDKFLVAFSNSIYWIAYFIGCFVTGALSDKLGRRNVASVLLIGLAVSTSGIFFTNNIYLYLFLRFVNGFCGLSGAIDYIILAESIDKKRLSKIGMTNQVIFVIGELACILFGYLFQQNWHWQFFAMAVPCYLYIALHIFFMPESARWLHSQRKFRKAEAALKKIAQINRRDPSLIYIEDAADSLKHSSELLGDHTDTDSREMIVNTSSVGSQTESKPNLFDLFRTIPSARLTITGALSWFACSLVYYGLTYDVQNIGGDFFLNNILLSLTEVPAWGICIAMDKFGRLRTFYTSIFICSIACAILPFTEPVLDGNLQIGFAVIGKFLAAGCFDMLYVYQSEQLPTVLRSTGLTFCSASARVASIAAPFVIELKLGPYNSVPYLIFAVCGLIVSTCVFFVGVETRGKPFITTVEEYKELARTKEVKLLDSDSYDHYFVGGQIS